MCSPASADIFLNGVINMTDSGVVDGTFIDGCIKTPPNLDTDTKTG